jgi:hypothetical protein
MHLFYSADDVSKYFYSLVNETRNTVEMFKPTFNKFKFIYDLLPQYEPKLINSKPSSIINNTSPVCSVYSSALPHCYYPKILFKCKPFFLFPLMFILYQSLEILNNTINKLLEILNNTINKFYSLFEKMWPKAKFKTRGGQKRNYGVYNNNENKINENNKKAKYEGSTANKGGSSAAAGGNNNDEDNNDDNNDKKKKSSCNDEKSDSQHLLLIMSALEELVKIYKKLLDDQGFEIEE